jgi:GAF domain-containing protein
MALWYGNKPEEHETMTEKGVPLDELLRLFEQSIEPERLLTALLPALGEVLPCDRCFLYLREPTQSLGIITHCWSRDGRAAAWMGADWLEDPTAPQDPLMTIALRTPVAVFVDDIETASDEVVDRAYEREKFQHRALVHAPLYQGNQLIGILECSIFARPRRWTEDDRQLIATLQTKLVAPVTTYIEQYQLFQR